MPKRAGRKIKQRLLIIEWTDTLKWFFANPLGVFPAFVAARGMDNETS